MRIIEKILPYLIVVLIAVSLHSCSIESYSTKKFNANNEILSYLNDNGHIVAPDSLGLVYIPLKQGNGVFPKDNAFPL